MPQYKEKSLKKQPPKILVIGSINMDDLLYIQHHPMDDGATLVERTAKMPGGHGSNCASALAALGAYVSMMGAVGIDSDGDKLITDLVSRGIDVTGVDRLAGEATGRVIIPSCGTEHHMYVIRGANDKYEPNLQSALETLKPDALVVFDPSRSTFEKLKVARECGYLKTPTYWCPGGINAGDQSLHFMLDIADTVILNQVERVALFSPETLRAFLKSKRDVITTLGKGGAKLEQENFDVTIPVSSTSVSDSVGAGDAFIAGYVLAALTNLSVEDKLGFANAVGSVAVTSTGARAQKDSLQELGKSLNDHRAPWSPPSIAHAPQERYAQP